MEQSALKNARRVVVKVGSALLTNDGRGLDRQMIENLDLLAGTRRQRSGFREFRRDCRRRIAVGVE